MGRICCLMTALSDNSVTMISLRLGSVTVVLERIGHGGGGISSALVSNLSMKEVQR